MSLSKRLNRHNISSLAFALALGVAAIVFRHALLNWFSGNDGATSPDAMSQAKDAATVGGAGATSTPGAQAEDLDAIDHYTCPMHPSVKQHAPGKCPICGMDLVPVTKAQQAQGVVTIDEVRRQLIGVRTGRVTEAPMQRAFRAVGHVTYDESTLTDVSLKVRGWVTKLFVSRTGQQVTAGQPLFLFYSPELYNAEQDFLLANPSSAAVASPTDAMPGRLGMLGKAARQRLHLLGIDNAQIGALEKSGVPSENVTIPSPASGFIIEKDIVEGASVDVGMRLYRIAALNKVWVEAEVYEADLAHVLVGQSATVTLDYLPGRSYDAKVSYIYPVIDPTARTGRIRVELANKELELRPGMYASVLLTSDASPRVQVPVSAVVYTGPRRLVFVDLGDGRFRPQEVRVGTEASGMYEVLEGLAPGDSVATSGVFLIAAEARISTAAKYWEKSPEGPEPSLDAPNNGMPLEPSGAAPMPQSAPPQAPPSLPKPAKPSTSAIKKDPAPSPDPAATATVFSCPMHPEVRSAAPGSCPKCGMKLEPIPSGGSK